MSPIIHLGGPSQRDLVDMLTDWELFHYAAMGGTVPATSRLRAVVLVVKTSAEATPELARRDRRRRRAA